MSEDLNISFFVLLKVKGARSAIDWCMENGLLASRYECHQCKNNMILTVRKPHKDRFDWRCRKDCHDVSRSFRKGSFFEKSKLCITDILLVTVYWLAKLPYHLIEHEVYVTGRTIMDWTSFCREICMHVMLNDRGMIGGDGVTVEIDISKFKKRTFRGKRFEGRWLFAGVERGSPNCFFKAE